MGDLMKILAAFLFLGSSAFADTLTLIAPVGEWHDPLVWDAGRVPVQADDVVIPAGMACTIEPLGLVATRKVDVAGTLTLDRETLVLGSDNPDVDVDCPITGTIFFKDDYANTPPARIVPDGGWVRFTGTGELNASRGNGEEYQGRLRCCAATGFGPCDAHSGKGFVVEAGVTVRGSMHLHACLVLNGTWIVDHPEDVSQLGQPRGTLCGGACAVPLTLEGTGVFILRAGRLEIGELSILTCQRPKVWIEGGTLTTDTPLRAKFKGCGK